MTTQTDRTTMDHTLSSTALAETEAEKAMTGQSRRALLTASVSIMALGSLAPTLAFAQEASEAANTAVETDGQVSVPEAATTDATTGDDVPPLLAERVLGDPDAPVTMFEYSSLTCPHCARFHNDTLPRLKQEYIDTGKLKIIYRDFPFDGVGLRASMLARCAPEERYFDFLDVLFKNHQRWSRSRDPIQVLTTFGTLVGMNANDVQACLANEDLQNSILTRQLEGQERFSIRSTPTFILNNDADRIIGAEDFSVFQRKIDRLLPDEAS